MSSPYRSILSLLAAACALAMAARAANIVAGNVTTTLGSDFFLDDAVMGGGDNNTSNFISGFWASGAAVLLQGPGWASGNAGISNTTVAAFRMAQPINTDFHFRFLVRSTETNVSASAPSAPGNAHAFFGFKINES